MTRQTIKIDADKCIGCGLCVNACQEGAIELINGKAQLVRQDHCDGLGNCLPVCPTSAISFTPREAVGSSTPDTLACGCAGTQVQAIAPPHSTASAAPQPGCPSTQAQSLPPVGNPQPPLPQNLSANASVTSQLRQWPCQIKLVPPNAPYFQNAHLLVAADCTAFAYGNFHHDYMRNRITLVGCPKLDNEDYSQKITAILQANTIKSVTIVRMEVPCCSGLEQAVITALQNSGKMIPWQSVTITSDGRVLEI